MQFCAKYQTLDAVPVGVLDEAGSLTSERSYIVRFDDGTQGVIDQQTFEGFFRRAHDAAKGSVPEPAARSERAGKVEAAKPATGPRLTKAPKKQPVYDAAPAAIGAQVTAEHPLTGEPARKILAALAKRPMSSSELSEETGLGGAHLYSTCGNLKTQGKVESFTDDQGDGTRRYRLPVVGGAK